MTHEEKLAALTNLHLLDSAAREMLTAIDEKLEGVETDTVEVNVRALKLLQLIMSVQRQTLSDLVERTLQTSDDLEVLMRQHGIRTV